jgi:cytochrome d ubiquinol oxidase subunit I
MYRRMTRAGAIVTLVAGLAVAFTGDLQGKIMTEVQPMKMASAEALYDTSDTCAPFSLFTVGTPDGKTEKFAITVPCLLSFLATGSIHGRVEGINQLRAQYQERYGSDPGAAYYHAGDYVPIIPVTYWSFRFMIGLGVFSAVGAALLLFLTRRGRAPSSRWLGWLSISLPVAMVLGHSWGWIFTEMGRQPWVVFGLMTTEHGVSPGVSVAEAAISLLALTLLYAVLAVVEIGLMVKYVRRGADPFEEPPRPSLRGRRDADTPLSFAY